MQGGCTKRDLVACFLQHSKEYYVCVKINQTVQEQREDWEYILYACVVCVKECQFRREHFRQRLI